MGEICALFEKGVDPAEAHCEPAWNKRGCLFPPLHNKTHQLTAL